MTGRKQVQCWIDWLWYDLVSYLGLLTGNQRMLDYASDLFERGWEKYIIGEGL